MRPSPTRQGGLFRFGMAAATVGYIQLNAMAGFDSAATPGGGDAQVRTATSCLTSRASFSLV